MIQKRRGIASQITEADIPKIETRDPQIWVPYKKYRVKRNAWGSGYSEEEYTDWKWESDGLLGISTDRGEGGPGGGAGRTGLEGMAGRGSIGGSGGSGGGGPHAYDPNDYTVTGSAFPGKLGGLIEFNPDPDVRIDGADLFGMLEWIFGENWAKLEDTWDDLTQSLYRNGGRLKEGLHRLRTIFNLILTGYEKVAKLLEKPVHKAVKKYFAIDAVITAWEILWKGGPFEMTPSDVLNLIPGWFGVLYGALEELTPGNVVTQKYLKTSFRNYMEGALREICKTMRRFKDWTDDEINKFLGPYIDALFKALYGGLPPG